TSAIEHEIPLIDETPFRIPYRRIAPSQYPAVRKQIENMEKAGVIQQSQSPWASPLVIVTKKGIDFRQLNLCTVQDTFPLPRIDEALDALKGAKYFSTLDLTCGHWQVPVAEKDRPKTAFRVPWGHWECLRMPFGLQNAPATFQCLVEMCLGDQNFQSVLLYLDDIICISSTLEEHLERLQLVFDRLRQYGLKLKPSKCHFFQTQVTYLGHVVSVDGISTDPEKIAKVKEWPIPKNHKELSTFLGFTGYYRRFLKDYSKTVHQVTLEGRKAPPFVWLPEHQDTFESLRERLVTTPILEAESHHQAVKISTEVTIAALEGALIAPIRIPVPLVQQAINVTSTNATHDSVPGDVLNHAEKQPTQMSKEHMALAQREDLVLQRVFHYLEHGIKPTSEERKREDHNVTYILRQWPKLKIQPDGILYQVSTQRDGKELYQLILPSSLREQALHSLHNDNGHLGVDRTVDLLQHRFYWPRLYASTKSWITKCRRCCLRKTRPPELNVTTTEPLELVCIYFLTLDKSRGGIEDVLILTDHFTRYAQAYACPNQKAATVVHVLWRNFFSHYRFPSCLHSDQGCSFESDLIRELCKVAGIKKTRTTPYHAQCNGGPEHFNTTLMDMIGTLESSQKVSWKDYLQTLTHAYNVTRHESTGYSPFFLMFGRHPRLPIDIAFGMTPSMEEEETEYNEYVAQLKNRLRTAHSLAKEFSGRSKDCYKQNYDKKVRADIPVEEGDRVLVQNKLLR
uniref:Gypsy retrotransposon integrase-like protein 1 n=1 Tax=Latimeria chalumnae TaxID=7897 RepID=H3BHK6_LATCH